MLENFLKKPKIKTTWWVIGLGLALFISIILGIFAIVSYPMLDLVSAEKIGWAIGLGLGVLLLILPIPMFIMSIYAFVKGERSWVLWIGFVPSFLIVAFWIWLLVVSFSSSH